MYEHYQVLGVARDATESQIKSAFRTLAKKYHPDLHPDDKACQEKFTQVNEAYSVLGDAKKRKEYDAQQAQMGQNRGGAGTRGKAAGGGFGGGAAGSTGGNANPFGAGGFGQAFGGGFNPDWFFGGGQGSAASSQQAADHSASDQADQSGQGGAADFMNMQNEFEKFFGFRPGKKK